MLTSSICALALARFGVGRGEGLFWLLFELAVVGVLVWALTRPSRGQSAKD
jgi:hypothetical protein